MSYATWLIILGTFIFIGGISAGIYNGNEMIYNSSLITIPQNGSNLQIGIYKIVDGTMTLSFELSNIIARYAIDNGYDLNFMFKTGINLIYLGFILAIAYFITKLFVYVYIIYKEIKLTKSENQWLNSKIKGGKNV